MLSAYASHLAALQTSGLEALWPSNAIVFAILLLAGHSRKDILTIAGGQAAGSLLLHIIRADPPVIIGVLTCANVTESLLAFVLLRRIGIKGGLIDRVGNFFALVLAVGGAGLASSTIGGLGLWIAHVMPFWEGWHSWYVSGVLSSLMVTPTVVVAVDIVRGRRMRGLTGYRLIEAAALLGLIAAVTSYVFLITRLPLTFTIAPCVLLATFRFRVVGAVAGISTVAIIAAATTAAGRGPIAFLLWHQPGDQVLMLQLFIAITLLSALPVAAILTERDHQAEETRAFAEHFKSVVENIGEVIFRIDGQGRWAYLNPAWESLTGQPLTASLGRSWLDLVEPVERVELGERADAVLRGEDRSTRRVVRLQTPDGLRWVELFIQGLRDQDGRIAGATGTLRDIDDRKRLEEHVITAKRRAEQRAREATLLASTDELTGIANRRAFMGQLDREIAGAAEFGWPLAVAMFDVDHFKAVNDRYGHAVGDRVLQLIAARAAAVVRGGDLVGRLGGEEFGILMPGASLEEAALVAERLREAMETARELDESLPGVTISIGIATRETQRSAAELLAAADVALYAAKGEGRNRVRVAA
ncbi:MAG TPA: diguanylate cyclase [Sphingomonas sp.]|uniref:diguanylate cyclase n=1 Tax=Sphingomonas sp. TaxID=28214 RepID=UPI002BC886F0|nr:diguanylate cyclase [Sphingomonas sp.]HMI20396.1 diguanylate cyclase [Sphingomonas sp.]